MRRFVAATVDAGDHSSIPEPSDLPDVNRRPADDVDPSALARALEASWDHRTGYGGVVRDGNPAFGQCCPTSRVVQWFYPEYEIARGEVWTGTGVEDRFWNVRGSGAGAEWLDFSWTRFPPGSVVQGFVLFDRHALGDRKVTVERCALLLRRVLSHLAGGAGGAVDRPTP